jgi:hypothetical protein
MYKIFCCICVITLSLKSDAQKILNVPVSILSPQQTAFLRNKQQELTGQVSDYKSEKIKYENKCRDVEPNSSLDETCKTQQKEFDSIMNQLVIKIKKFNDTLILLVKQRIEAIHAKISKDSIAIRSLNFNKSVEDFEKWARLTQKEKEDLIKMDRELLVEGLTASLGKNVDELTSIDLKRAKDVKKKMEALGITNPFARENKLLQKGIILLGQAKNKKEKGEAIRFYIDGFGKILKKGLNESKDDPSGFEKFKEVVEIFLLYPGTPPFVRLAVTGTFNAYTLVDALGGLYYGNQDINNMTKQTEENLKNLKSFTDLMKGHVSELIKTKDALTELQK